MSEPSKEAYARADAALPGDMQTYLLQRAVATALQELMDERDAWIRRYAKTAAKHITVVERAEAAEAGLAECVRRVREWWEDQPANGKALCRMLDEYAPKTEEPGR